MTTAINSVYEEIGDRLIARGRDALTKEDVASSGVVFVRGQTQIAVASPNATGLRLTAHQAMEDFGLDTVLDALFEGVGHFLASPMEPARTLIDRRMQLGISLRQAARSAEVSPETVERAETVGQVTPVRELMRYAQALALDERALGVRPGADGDAKLATRLRSLGQEHTQGLNELSVVGLAEAAWVTRRQVELSEALEPQDTMVRRFEKSDDYGSPAWQRGFELASRARGLLDQTSGPIESVRELFDQLRIPLIQAELPRHMAGATVANGPHRGVVVNVEGANENVWVRRMTMCHELGHLLWDPAERLNAIKVDSYNSLKWSRSASVDSVEARANAFAVSFLAPPEMVRLTVMEAVDRPINAVAERFGISRQAAEHHVKNILEVDRLDYQRWDREPRFAPSQEWLARESYTVEFFPIRSTPISRRGRFASLVAQAVQVGYLTIESAALHLRCTVDEIDKNLGAVASLHDINIA